MRRLVDEYRASERRVCGLMEIPRMSYRYRCRRDDSALRERLLALAREKPRFGYRRLWVMLTSEERVNHKRTCAAAAARADREVVTANSARTGRYRMSKRVSNVRRRSRFRILLPL